MAPVPGGNPSLWTPLYNVTCRVTNAGDLAGATVAQLYATFPTEGPGAAPVDTPVRVHRGFEKVFLQPGQSLDVGFELMRRDVSFWDVVDQQWRIPKGEVVFSVGLSSRDIKGTVSIDIVG